MARPGSETVVGRYEIRGRLGEGGEGTVFRVWDPLTDRILALKRLPARNPRAVERFYKEFSALREVVHPQLTQVFDFGIERRPGATPRCFFTSELIEGTTLDAFADGRSYEEVASAVEDVLRAVLFLHTVGLRHNDLKPANILVSPEGRATVIDLGHASALRTPASDTVAGTPRFVAPELLAGEPADERSDLYSLGVVFEEVARRAHRVERLAAIARQLQEPSPEHRPDSMHAVLAALGMRADDHRGRSLSFLGRRAALDSATQFLASLASASETERLDLKHEAGPPMLTAVGPTGSGRSRLLAEWKWRAQLRFLCVEGFARRPLAVQELLSVAARLHDAPHDARVVPLALTQLRARSEPTILVLDDIDALAPGQRSLFDALLRMLEPGDPVAVMATALQAPPTGLVVDVGPLSDEDARRFLGATVTGHQLTEALDASGRLPEDLARIRDRPKGVSPRQALADTSLPQSQAAALERLPPEARRALATAAALDGRLSSSVVEALGFRRSDLHGLVARGGLRVNGDGYWLPAQGDAPRLLRVLPTEARDAHRALAEALPASAAAERVRHLLLSGDSAAAAVLRASAKAARGEPLRFARAAALFGEPEAAGVDDPSAFLLAAELLEASGDPHTALRVLARGRRHHPQWSEPTLYIRAGSALLSRGRGRAALRHLRRAGNRTEARALVVRALVQVDEPAEAERVAEAALREDPNPGELLEALGIALSYQGRNDEARRALDRAVAATHHRDPRPRSLVRLRSYLAIVAFRQGDLVAAASNYQAALQAANQHGLTDQIASAALNLGTVQHRRGDYGPALSSYREARVMAQAIDKRRTEIAALYNEAQCLSDVGLFVRAQEQAQHTRTRAEEVELPFFVAAADMLLGEVATGRGDTDAALLHLDGADERFADIGASRERIDVALARAEAERRSANADAARQAIEAAEAKAAASGAEDLLARAKLLRAQLALDGGEAPALETLEEVSRYAGESGQRDLQAEAEQSLAAACRLRGAPAAAERHARNAAELWDRCAATLDGPMRDAFRSHLRRQRSTPEPDRTEAPRSRERTLERLIAINGKLAASLDFGEVLAFTMDAAIELTGAERGFVILAPGNAETSAGLEVAIARNVDRERVESAYLKFSRSIAEEVIRTGEPMLTTDAFHDQRFADERSVQAMRLRSVLGVPIRARGKVLGALYLDNRFTRGKFGDHDIADLLAFADQAALALENARLFRELGDRTRQLEEERSRIEASLADRTREVVHLHRTLRLAEPGPRSGLVAKSRAMEALHAAMDRVADTSLTVLVTGESGTGKELVARALHSEGPHREQPFVAINCAAIPDALLESELFGHVKGAFTGAEREREGLFVVARNGTVFLDEVGELPLSTQAKLLRVLQEREVRPVGATRAQPISARIVAATNRNLREEVNAGRFREDLFYRIAVVELRLPPLRERKEDIPLLVHDLLERAARELGRKAPGLTKKALEALQSHDWPGNVRQLENVLRQALVMASDPIRPSDFLLPTPSAAPPETFSDFQGAERKEIATALAESRWNVAEVARRMNISRTTLYRKMRRYGLERSDTDGKLA
ncbi:MAG: sigma 54-interacting transcriptional regulator [Myxococcota bacterium]